MRFLLSVIHDGTNTASPEEAAAIDAFNEELQSNGQWVIAVGVQGPETAFMFDNRRDLGHKTQSPFVVNQEFVNGFWIVDVPDEETAHAVAASASKACNRKIELRPLYR